MKTAVLETYFDLPGEHDTDSLHILPLSIIPLQTRALIRARLIKNIRLEAVVELFNGAKTGSGQLSIPQLDTEYGWTEKSGARDRLIMHRLARLPSYDVYSLRVLLREQGITVNDHNALQLTEAKKSELTDYMKVFTRPLLRQIYGNEDVGVEDSDDLIALFRDPNVAKARERLEIMARKLEIAVEDVPKFLEDYGDIFLSFSYYRQCLDQISPIISDFLDTLTVIRRNWQLGNDARLMGCCDRIENEVNELMAAITGRFENFDRSSREMWDNLSAERFRRVEELIKAYHTMIGGVLCALSIKMRAWQRTFPGKDSAGPVKLAEFIMSEMVQGLERIQRIESSTPMLADLDGATRAAT